MINYELFLPEDPQNLPGEKPEQGGLNLKLAPLWAGHQTSWPPKTSSKLVFFYVCKKWLFVAETVCWKRNTWIILHIFNPIESLLENNKPQLSADLWCLNSLLPDFIVLQSLSQKSGLISQTIMFTSAWHAVEF